MKWASALSEKTPLELAVAECVAELRQQLGEVSPDLAVVFASAHYQDEYDAVPGLIREQLDSPLVLGCSGGGIIGNGQEVEQRPALSITAASLPDVTLVDFHLEDDRLPDLDAGPQAWETLMQVSAARPRIS